MDPLHFAFFAQVEALQPELNGGQVILAASSPEAIAR
jgi:hypothetical protein